MSRITFRIDDQAECTVGWDPSLATFFAQVYEINAEGERTDDEKTGEPNTILWVGTSRGEIRTVDELERKLQSHAVIPNSIRDELFAIEVD
jgi:hypothetical protein